MIDCGLRGLEKLFEYTEAMMASRAIAPDHSKWTPTRRGDSLSLDPDEVHFTLARPPNKVAVTSSSAKAGQPESSSTRWPRRERDSRRALIPQELGTGTNGTKGLGCVHIFD
jgi:hypothetical protein